MLKFRIEAKPVADTYYFPLTQWVGVSDASGTVDLLDGNEFVIIPKNYDFFKNQRTISSVSEILSGKFCNRSKI